MSEIQMLYVCSMSRVPEERRERAAQTGTNLARSILGLTSANSFLPPSDETHTLLRSEDVMNLCEAIAAHHPEWLDSGGYHAHIMRQIRELD